MPQLRPNTAPPQKTSQNWLVTIFQSGILESLRWNVMISVTYFTIVQQIIIWKVKVKVMSDSLQPHGPYSPWNSPGQNTRVGSLSLLQGIFPVQFSSVAQSCPTLCDPRDKTQVSHIAGGFVTSWATRESWRGPSHIKIFTLATNVLITWRRKWKPIPVLLPGKSHGQRSLVSCSPWGG